MAPTETYEDTIKLNVGKRFTHQQAVQLERHFNTMPTNTIKHSWKDKNGNNVYFTT